MPTPREAFTNSVERQANSGARLRPADFGAAGEILGRATQGFGQDLGKVADNINEMQKREAETAAQEADNIRTQRRLELLHGQFYTLEGKAAVDAAKELPAKLKKIDDEVAGEVLKTNSWARQMYNNVSAKRNADDTPGIIKHAATQRKAWEKATDQQAFDLAVSNAVSNFNNTEVVAQSVATTGNLAVKQMLRDGVTDPETLEMARRKGQAKAIGEVSQRIELEQGAEAAQIFIRQREDQMDPADYTDLLTALAPRAEDEMTDDLVDGHLQYVGGESEDPLAPQSERQEADIPDHRETPVDIAKGVELNSGFGRRSAPLKPDGTRGSSNHGGWDLNYPEGTPVPATLSGIARVRNQGKSGYGLYVDIDHGNGLVTRYAHLKGTKIKDGQVVKQGDIIALSGSSGGVGAHLHYEVRQNDAPVDPKTVHGRELAVGGHRMSAARASRGSVPGGRMDLEATIADIKVAGYIPRVEQKMIAKARERFSLESSYRAASEDTVRERVAAALNTLPDPENFTDISQLPSDVYNQLRKHPELELAYRRQAQTNVDNIEAKRITRNNAAVAAASLQADLEFATMLYGNEKAFMDIDLSDPRQTGHLSAADRMKWMSRQKELEKSRNGDPKTTNFDAMRTAVRRFAGKDEPADIGLAFDEANRREQAWIDRNPGKPVPDAVREGIAREVMTKYTLVIPGKVYGESAKTVRGYQVPDTAQKLGGRQAIRRIEVDSFEAVKAQLQQIWGRTPRDAEVRAEIAKRNAGGGLRL